MENGDFFSILLIFQDNWVTDCLFLADRTG